MSERAVVDRNGDVAPRPDGSWFDAACTLRNRFLANPKFQRWVASFPLTRSFARREAHAVFDLCAGFVYSQVLLACVQLRLLENLEKCPKTLDEIASQHDLPRDRAAKLVKAAVALKLIEHRSGDRFGLALRGAAILGNPSIATMVEHHRLLYADLKDPVALVSGKQSQTNLSAYWTYAGETAGAKVGAGDAETYSGLMSASQDLLADDVLDAYPVGRHSRMLDVGGGEGRFLMAVGARHANLELSLFDLPPVAERARQHFSSTDLAGRVTIHVGSFLTDALPGGFDLITLNRICFDHGDAAVLTLLKAIKAALADNGTLLIAEPISGSADLAAITDAYYGFYLMSMGGGTTRSLEDFRALGVRAGFSRAAQIRTRRPLLTGLIALHP